ncbi:MAG: hypothetical protein RUMPE_00893 [Eubacteriales bacterium SKADARSKE-1]|nr:hypothetical protein [Eubacteriales bacterium SKADARSKE-1]
MVKKFLLWISIVNLVIMVWFISKIQADIVPIHFNINGAIDGWGSKWFLLIGPIIPFLLSICFEIYNTATKNNRNVQVNKCFEKRVICAIIIVFILMGWLMLASAQFEKLETKFLSCITILLGVLILYISTIMPKFKLNKTFGIRTPWTLKSEFVWNKTHKLGGTLGIIGGILMIGSGLTSLIINISWICFWGIVLGIILCAIVPIIYSYKIYKNPQ